MKKCITSLSELSYPTSNFEVIIVDDGSPMYLKGVIKQFDHQLNIQLLKQNNAGPAAARNTGAAIAKGRYLAFTDDDCCPAPDWLNKLEQQLKITPDRIIGGKTTNNLKKNWYSETSQLIIDIVYENYNADPDNARFLASNNMVVPKKEFLELRGFQPDWRTSEDRELCDRWIFNGHKMTYLPVAINYHSNNLTFWGFCKQHFTYGQGAYHFHQTRKNRQSGTIQQEVHFHLNITNWLLEPFKREEYHKAFGMVSLMIIWQVVNFLGFTLEMLFPTNRKTFY